MCAATALDFMSKGGVGRKKRAAHPYPFRSVTGKYKSETLIPGDGLSQRRQGVCGIKHFDNDVRIGPAKTKRTDTGYRRVQVARPCAERLLHLQMKVVEGNVRIRLFEMEAGRNESFPERQRYLNQSCDAGRGFEMADVQFH
jgi:hypothetical protein